MPLTPLGRAWGHQRGSTSQGEWPPGHCVTESRTCRSGTRTSARHAQTFAHIPNGLAMKGIDIISYRVAELERDGGYVPEGDRYSPR